MTIYQHLKPEETFPIVDGVVYYENHEIGFSLTLKVKQVKDRGVADADGLISLNEKYHKPLASFLLKLTDTGECTVDQIITWYHAYLLKQGFVGQFRYNNWKRPISEFMRRGLLSMRKVGKQRFYSINREVITKCLDTGLFPPLESKPNN